MSLIKVFLKKICQPLDGFLWHKNISHPIVRPALRNQIFLTGGAILFGGVLFTVFPWLFWFGAGLFFMTWIFWSWTRFFVKTPITGFSNAVFGFVLFQFLFRLLIIAILLYFALAWFNASAYALIAGLATGAFTALLSYAWHLKHGQTA